MKLRNTPARVYRRATALMRTDPDGVRTGFIALVISTGAGLVAGIVLGSITGTLVSLPGLVVLAPGAIALRGNIFGSLASRLSTMAQLGELNFSRKRSTPIGQNVRASIYLSIACSLILAFMAKIISEAFGIPGAISYADFFIISVIGAIIPTIIVLLVTIVLAKACVKKEWDLDNVGAPLITATADMLTIPSLVLATVFVGRGLVTDSIALSVTIMAALFFIVGFFSRLIITKQVFRQSLPILIAGGTISLFAGLTVQGRIEPLDRYPVLIVLIPPMLSINGAIGAILSARIATKLHLGIVRADKFGFSPVSEDITVSYLLSVPIFFVLGVFCSIYSVIGHLSGPGVIVVIAISMIAGVIATTLSNMVGYVSAVMTYRFGWDPDNIAVPAVTSVSDFVGAVILMITIGALT